MVGAKTINSGATDYKTLFLSDITDAGLSPPYNNDNQIPTSLWQDGDQSGSGTFVGNAKSYQECINLVMQEEPTATAATMMHGLTCRAVFDMSETVTSTVDYYKTVHFNWLDQDDDEMYCNEL